MGNADKPDYSGPEALARAMKGGKCFNLTWCEEGESLGYWGRDFYIGGHRIEPDKAGLIALDVDGWTDYEEPKPKYRLADFVEVEPLHGEVWVRLVGPGDTVCRHILSSWLVPINDGDTPDA